MNEERAAALKWLEDKIWSAKSRSELEYKTIISALTQDPQVLVDALEEIMTVRYPKEIAEQALKDWRGK